MDLTCEAQVQEQADADKALADRLAAERKAARTK
jgi:hypothetical protein